MSISGRPARRARYPARITSAGGRTRRDPGGVAVGGGGARAATARDDSRSRVASRVGARGSGRTETRVAGPARWNARRAPGEATIRSADDVGAEASLARSAGAAGADAAIAGARAREGATETAAAVRRASETAARCMHQARAGCERRGTRGGDESQAEPGNDAPRTCCPRAASDARGSSVHHRVVAVETRIASPTPPPPPRRAHSSGAPSARPDAPVRFDARPPRPRALSRGASARGASRAVPPRVRGAPPRAPRPPRARPYHSRWALSVYGPEPGTPPEDLVGYEEELAEFERNKDELRRGMADGGGETRGDEAASRADRSTSTADAHATNADDERRWAREHADVVDLNAWATGANVAAAETAARRRSAANASVSSASDPGTTLRDDDDARDDPAAVSSSESTAPLRPGLYLVGTPIGNLEDITLRALRVLRTADAILAEDTRHTARLLRRYGIETRGRLVSYHAHNLRARRDGVINRLRGGDALALVSDAGTPAVADPGADLAAACAEEGLAVVPVPGPSAIPRRPSAPPACGGSRRAPGPGARTTERRRYNRRARTFWTPRTTTRTMTTAREATRKRCTAPTRATRRATMTPRARWAPPRHPLRSTGRGSRSWGSSRPSPGRGKNACASSPTLPARWWRSSRRISSSRRSRIARRCSGRGGGARCAGR